MDKKPKLALSMIVGDFEPKDILERALSSVSGYVDEAYITITYKDKLPSKDHPLVKFLEKNQVHLSYFKWVNDFSATRNYNLSQIPKTVKFLLWLDTDDVFQNAQALPDIVADMEKYNQAGVFLNYLYMVELNPDNSIHEVLIEHKRERIIRNDDTFKWVGALHETMIEQRQENIVKVLRDECAVLHLSDVKRIDTNLERNIKILEIQVEKEQHRDPRTIIYLAKAYFDKIKMVNTNEEKRNYTQLALALFREYLEGSGRPGEEGYREGSGWAEERSTAWSYVSEILRWSGDYDKAIEAINNAIEEAPIFPRYYIDKAVIYTMKKDMAKAKHWLRVSTEIPEPSSTIISMPRDLKVNSLEVDYHVAMAEGDTKRAIVDLNMLIKIMPYQEEFKKRLKVVESIDMANRAAQSIVYVGKYLEQIKEEDKIQHLVRAIPRDLQKEKFASEMRHQFLPLRTWNENEIAILCGPGWEEWTPDSIKTGLGGSEEAVVYLSKELTKLGWKVTVFANPAAKTGNYEGVEYKPWYDLNPKDTFNVLILWRAIGFADVNPKARFTLLWAHDVPNNADFTEERLKKINKIAPLSEFHKSLFRMQKVDGTFVKIPEEKFFLTANGISLFSDKGWEGNPHRMMYCSSLDRGIAYFLSYWEQVRKKVPDAELHVYYGFNIFDAMYANNPGRQMWKQKMLEMLRQPGITYHGRVGHEELENEFRKSGLWIYPCSFDEISCVSAMKAQALGSIPCVTDFAALKETVRFGGIRVDADITSKKGQEEYVKALISILKDKKEQESIRANMIKGARANFGWNLVAQDWDSLMKRSLKGV